MVSGDGPAGAGHPDGLQTDLHQTLPSSNVRLRQKLCNHANANMTETIASAAVYAVEFY